MNMVWDPSQTQQTLQPNVQLSYQAGQSLVSGPTQQPVQPTVQTSAPGSVQQLGPSSPQTLPPTTATTTAFPFQPTTLVSGVSVALVSTILASVKTPQVSVP